MKKNKKIIAFIANGFGLSPVLSGGEVRLFNLLKRVKKNWVSILLTTSGGFKASENFFKKIKFNVINIRCSFFLKKEYFSLQRLSGYFISALDTFFKLKKINVDAIYTSSDFICDIIPAYLLKRKKNYIKWFAMLHHKYINPFLRPGNFIKNFILYTMQNLTLKLIAQKADCVFILETQEGKVIKNFLIKNGYKGKVIKVKNGINIEKNIFYKNLKKDKNLSVFVGGIRATKGIYDIIPIWQKIINYNNSLKLIIIGKGSNADMNFLKKEIKEKKLTSNIILAGYLNENKLKEYFKKSYIFFFPSHEEGWGISILEALKYKCIPVTYDLPAFKILKKYIYTVPCFNKEKFAEKFIKIINLQKKFFMHPSFLKNFSWDEILKKEINYIRKSI